MKQRAYWLDLFTARTWEEFKAAGARVSGFRENRWKTVQKLRPGDYLLCYLTGISRFIGVLEVQFEPYKDDSVIWAENSFPSRVKVKLIHELTPETGVPILDLRAHLSIFKDLESSPNSWTGHVRGSPSKWRQADGEAVLQAIQAAVTNPITRPFEKAKLAYRPKKLESAIGTVVVPDAEPADLTSAPQPKEISAHTEIQWLLAKLGNDMGLDIWIARNDKNKDVSGKRFADLPRLKTELPLQFDEATNKTIELIDVLWLQKHSILAAFEIESTTSIYSGLLRMSDLISMQPNLNIPLYIVGPDERREKVVDEINRPTFSKLAPPMYEMCRFIAFSTLRRKLGQVSEFVQHLKPDFIDAIAESCEIEEV